MSISIDSEAMHEVTFFVLDNIKTLSQIKEDILSEKCIPYLDSCPTPGGNLESLFGQSFEKIKMILYYDGRFFYRVGKEFQTKEASELFEQSYG